MFVLSFRRCSFVVVFCPDNPYDLLLLISPRKWESNVVRFKVVSSTTYCYWFDDPCGEQESDDSPKRDSESYLWFITLCSHATLSHVLKEASPMRRNCSRSKHMVLMCKYASSRRAWASFTQCLNFLHYLSTESILFLAVLETIRSFLLTATHELVHN